MWRDGKKIPLGRFATLNEIYYCVDFILKMIILMANALELMVARILNLISFT